MKLFERYTKDTDLDPQELEQISDQLINAGLDFQKQENWAKKLVDEHGFDRPSPRKKLRLIPTWLKVAAGLLLLIGLYFLWPKDATTLSLQTQLAQILEEEPLPHNDVRKGPSELEALQQSFIDAYNAEEFTEAVALGSQLIQQETTKSNENLFYLALSHFYLKDYEKARSILAPLRANIAQGRPFDQESKWFLSLSYLKLGEIEEAEPLLEDLRTAGSWKSDAARQLLDLLSK